MEQLKMYWKNDGTPAVSPEFPEGYTLMTMPELENGVEQWLDIMQYGLSAKREGFSYYKSCMLDLPCYEEDKCFFIVYGGKAIATLTVVCDPETKDGLIHMVGSLPESRGKGVGKAIYAAIRDYAKQRKCHSVSLNVWSCNETAYKFYVNLGLTPRKTYMEERLDAE